MKRISEESGFAEDGQCVSYARGLVKTMQGVQSDIQRIAAQKEHQENREIPSRYWTNRQKRHSRVIAFCLRAALFQRQRFDYSRLLRAINAALYDLTSKTLPYYQSAYGGNGSG